jgi:hypothetical protein
MAMQQGGRSRAPDERAIGRFDRDYRVFLEMHAQRRALDDIAAEGASA